MQVTSVFSAYQTEIDGQECYFAGLPGYPRNFSRDTFIAGLIAADEHLLWSQIQMSTRYQGERTDIHTGEESGKIHHEYPGIMFRPPLFTTYNACDTTALYLIGLEVLDGISPAGHISDTYRHQIAEALGYLHRHVSDGIFWEFPPAGAEQFALRITYWKDSIVPSREGKEEPAYPVAFALSHFQAARGVLAAARLLGRPDLEAEADRMYWRGIEQFISDQAFCVMQDQTARLEQPSSDELHLLAFVPARYRDALPLDAIRTRAQGLVTAAGIACTTREVGESLSDDYHGHVVWIFEQALIHYGASKFGLDDIAAVTERCAPHIEDGHELLSVIPEPGPLGNRHQLWSVAAKLYFSDAPSLRQNTWL
jgi:hypothetical protein